MQIMCNSKSGRHNFWYFEIPEAFTLCHEAKHPEWIKVWYSFTVWLRENAVGALPPATQPSVREFAYVMEWRVSSIGLLQTKKPSALSVGWRVRPWVHVSISHRKSQIGFGWSPALNGTQVVKSSQAPTLDRADASFVCCTH